MIVYEYDGEARLAGQFLHILIAIISISLFLRFYKNGHLSSSGKLRKSDALLIPMVLSLILLFAIPDGSNAGMMSDRLCLMFYMLFAAWGVSQYLPGRSVYVFMLLIAAFHLGLLFKQQNGYIRGFNRDAISIYNASKYIDDNSIVLPVHVSENSNEGHFSDYLGIDKPLVILENYEATISWFPVKWNDRHLPRIKLGQYDHIKGIKWVSNINSANIKEIDFVFLYGNLNKINDANWSELRIVLEQNYKAVFASEDKYISIYKKL